MDPGMLYRTSLGEVSSRISWLNEHNQIDGRRLPHIIRHQGRWEATFRPPCHINDVRMPDMALFLLAQRWCEVQNASNVVGIRVNPELLS